MADSKLKLYFPGKLHRMLEFFTNSYFIESDLGGCDFIFFNEFLLGRKNMNRILKGISNSFRGTGKKVTAMVIHDYEQQYRHFDNMILLRVSVRASKKRENEILVPYLFECKDEAFSPSEATDLPRVGFCGYTRFRRRIIKTFESSTQVESNFIERNRFWGGDPHNPNLVNSFYENLRTNEFNICQRGKGNYSMRFYQTLAVGRIPVLVNTDMELPLQSEILWNEFIVFENSERECVERLIECHREGKTEAMQARCAEVFRTRLSRHVFIEHLSKQLRERFLPVTQRYAA